MSTLSLLPFNLLAKANNGCFRLKSNVLNPTRRSGLRQQSKVCLPSSDLTQTFIGRGFPPGYKRTTAWYLHQSMARQNPLLSNRNKPFLKTATRSTRSNSLNDKYDRKVGIFGKKRGGMWKKYQEAESKAVKGDDAVWLEEMLGEDVGEEIWKGGLDGFQRNRGLSGVDDGHPLVVSVLRLVES
jgi:hypothetical protein